MENNINITDTHIIFWGSFLSNFEPCTIKYGKYVFKSAEQLFMWFKAQFFSDIETALKILKADNPKDAKKLGRTVKNFDEEKWVIVREHYMMEAVYAKFHQNKNLFDKLKSVYTSGKTFVEGSPYDCIWGIGINWLDDAADDESKWKGLNLLGKCLDNVIIRLGITNK